MADINRDSALYVVHLPSASWYDIKPNLVAKTSGLSRTWIGFTVSIKLQSPNVANEKRNPQTTNSWALRP
jgi:hypothetical protein